MSEAKGVRVFIGRFRLPRIIWYATYWPPSKKALQKLNERLTDALKKGEEFDLNKISLLDIEGDDLSAVWEPIIEDHPMFNRNLPSESNNRENNRDSESLSPEELNSQIKSKDVGELLKGLSKTGNITINIGNWFSGKTLIEGDVVGRNQTKRKGKELQKRPSKYIFLAYATEDQIKVNQIFSELKQRGHLPWMDKKNLLPGQDWKSKIEFQISKSDYFILCWSKNSVQKQGFIQK